MKITRNRATREIHAAAGRLSALLLGHENACFARIRGEWANTPTVRAGSVARFRSDMAQRTRIVDAYQLMLIACQGHVEDLAEKAAGRALANVKAELLWCERALPVRYRGLTAQAAEIDLAKIQTARVRLWGSEMAGTPSQFRQAMTYQISQADDVEELQPRLFSPEPARIRGHYQRGVWWAHLPGAISAARAVSIGTANQVKTQVMARFNELADG